MADTLRWFAAFLILVAVIFFIAGIGDVVNAKYADQKMWLSDYNSFTAYEQAKENAVLAKRQAGYNKIYISLASIPGIFLMFLFANMYDNIQKLQEQNRQNSLTLFNELKEMQEKLERIEKSAQGKTIPETETKKEYISIAKNSAPRPLHQIRPMSPLPDEDKSVTRQPSQQEKTPQPRQEEEKSVTMQAPPQETKQEPQQEDAPLQTPAMAERAQRKMETPQEETAKQVNHVSTVLLIVLIAIISIFALLYVINLPHP